MPLLLTPSEAARRSELKDPFFLLLFLRCLSNKATVSAQMYAKTGPIGDNGRLCAIRFFEERNRGGGQLKYGELMSLMRYMYTLLLACTLLIAVFHRPALGFKKSLVSWEKIRL